MITVDPGKDPGHPGPAISTPSLARFVRRAQAAVGLPGTVSVLLASDAELQRLNRQFRRKNKPTDVLSFPADPIPGLPPAQQHAGDLALSIDTAARQAEEHGHPLAAELRILLLHGLLHLAGLDHETDSGEMAAREAILRTRFRLPNTLIARTATPLGSKPAALPRTSSPRPKAQRSEASLERPPRSARTAKASEGKPTPHPQRRTRNNHQAIAKRRGPR